METNLAERLLRSLSLHEERLAVCSGTSSATHGALADRALSVAAALREQGIGPGQRVGLWLEKSIDGLAALLGTLFSGATYVPLDARAPLRRTQLVAADANIAALVVDQLRLAQLPDLARVLPGLRLVLCEGSAAAPAALAPPVVRFGELGPAPAAPPVAIDPESAAYILYTSGSTGRPKGVVVSHRAALGFVDWCLQTFQPRPADRMTSHAPWHFDLSTFDLFVTLCAGASVRLLNSTEAMLAPWIARNLASWGITVWYSVPAVLVTMVEQGELQRHGWPTARLVLFAGEAFPTPRLADLQRALPHARLFNLFGPTETNVCTYHLVGEIAAGETRPLPIGRVCEQLEGVILDDQLREVPRGAEGDLWIGGPNLFSGYWNDGERTRATLRADPRPGRDGLLYNTGDRVLVGDDELLHFRGRRDHMIKVRGHRVELGEVESAYHAIAEVREAAVIPVPRGDTHALAAFIAYRAGHGVSPATLRARLGELVPQYMVPETHVVVDRLPRNANGKVDRRSLAREHLAPTATDAARSEA